MKKQKVKRLNSIIAVVFYMLILISSSFLGSSFVVAEDVTYSNVLEDLQKDETFDVSSYPTNEEDYSLQVIQIAESEDKELFVYVYQPSGQIENLVATEIRFSTGINENAKYVDYSLTFLNSKDTLFKYKVNDFTVKSDALRYYDIVCIFRPWNSEIDEEAPGDNTINSVVFPVSKLWTATTINGVVNYTSLETETIEITEKYVGCYRYKNGFSLFADSCDSHYVAFSTDMPLDRLLEVEISYVRIPICKYYNLTGWHYVTNDYYNVPINETKILRDMDEGSNNPHWLFGKSYSWKRIQKVSDFLSDKDVSLDEETKQNLQSKEWILRFCETTYDNGGVSQYYYEDWINEVSILRLKFEENGEVYNLGVVDNKQSGDHLPDNQPRPWWNWLVVGLVGLITLVILIAFFPSILIGFFKLGWFVISNVFKGIWWLITAPFSIFKK